MGNLNSTTQYEVLTVRVKALSKNALYVEL